MCDMLFYTGYEDVMFPCQEWDIDALEESTRYDGFKKTDRVIV